MRDPDADEVLADPDGVLAGHEVVSSRDPERVRQDATTLLNGHRMIVRGDRRTFRARIMQTRVGAGTLMAFSYGTEVDIVAPPLEHFATVHLPLAGHMDVEHAGARITANTSTGVVFSADRPLRMRWSADLVVLVMRLERRTLEERLAGLTGRPPSTAIRFSPALDVGGSGAGLAGSVLALQRLIDAQRPAPLLPVVATNFEQTIANLMLLAHPHNHTDALAGFVAAPSARAARVVQDYVRQHPAEPLTVPDLAALAGISERGLHQAFRHHVGEAPATWVRNQRLDRAHHDLLRGNPSEDSVAAVASQLGFNHLGRFAASYRRRFGEHPSATLTRRT